MDAPDLLIDLLEKKEKLAAMLAPSFPIVYFYPSIVSMLRKLGFSYVVEVASGAKKTNEEIIALLQKNPATKYITSPCPTVVRMIRKTMPEYAHYLMQGVDSPMVATAKIVRERYPGYRPVFIGPCIVKKLEASEDVPELGIVVVTYKEMEKVFSHFSISAEEGSTDRFDISEPGLTRMYPLDGGLSHSSGLESSLASGKLRVVSGADIRRAVEQFAADPEVQLLDILYCPGGCIGGPGIQSPLSADDRKRRIIDYFEYRGTG